MAVNLKNNDEERPFSEVLEEYDKNNRKTRRLRGRIFSYMRAKSLLFFLALCAGCVLAFAIPLRPATSELEKRDLAEFPEFSWETLFSGSYFDDITLWFADTFPFRDELMTLNSRVQESYKVNQTVQIHGNIESGDDIPDIPTPPVKDDNSGNTGNEENKSDPDKSKDGNPGGENTGDPNKGEDPNTGTDDPGTVEDPNGGTDDPNGGGNTEDPNGGETADPPKIDATGDTQSFSAVLLAGNAAYEYYNFSQAAADKLISAVNTAASELSGIAKVYDIVIPTSIGITLPDDLKDSVNSSDMKKATDYIYGSMLSDVTTVNIYDALMQHRDEYIYFRTDHHWTALGAYYAYEQFMLASGKTPLSLSDYEELVFSGYLGSFYSSTSQSSALGNNPDTVYAYRPKGNISMTVTSNSGSVFKWPVVKDVSKSGSGSKYLTFIGGDNAYSEITNSDITDGASIVVVKESFGNAFVPFITANYEKVYVIDYRYWSGDLTDFVKENGIQEVLFMNNISATRSGTLMGWLKDII